MDLNAGLIITGDKTIEQVGEEAFAKLLRVLSGEITKNKAIQFSAPLISIPRPCDLILLL